MQFTISVLISIAILVVAMCISMAADKIVGSLKKQCFAQKVIIESAPSANSTASTQPFPQFLKLTVWDIKNQGKSPLMRRNELLYIDPRIIRAIERLSEDDKYSQCTRIETIGKKETYLVEEDSIWIHHEIRMMELKKRNP